MSYRPVPAGPGSSAGEQSGTGRLGDSGNDTLVAGRYRLDEPLAHEFGSSLWRAYDLSLNRTVTVRTLAPGQEQTGAAVSAARTASRLGDPRLVQIFDADDRDAQPYLVTEWPAGERFDVALASGPLGVVRAAEVISAAAAVISAAHAAGLAHLRLRPESLWLNQWSDIKLADLGTAAALAGATAGNPAEADTEGLAQLLYAALTGFWPGSEPSNLPAAPKRGGRFSRPAQLRRDLPIEMDAVVCRALFGDDNGYGPPIVSPAGLTVALATIARQAPDTRPMAVVAEPEPVDDHTRPFDMLPGVTDETLDIGPGVADQTFDIVPGMTAEPLEAGPSGPGWSRRKRSRAERRSERRAERKTRSGRGTPEPTRQWDADPGDPAPVFYDPAAFAPTPFDSAPYGGLPYDVVSSPATSGSQPVTPAEPAPSEPSRSDATPASDAPAAAQTSTWAESISPEAIVPLPSTAQPVPPAEPVPTPEPAQAAQPVESPDSSQAAEPIPAAQSESATPDEPAANAELGVWPSEPEPSQSWPVARAGQPGHPTVPEATATPEARPAPEAQALAEANATPEADRSALSAAAGRTAPEQTSPLTPDQAADLDTGPLPAITDQPPAPAEATSSRSAQPELPAAEQLPADPDPSEPVQPELSQSGDQQADLAQPELAHSESAPAKLSQAETGPAESEAERPVHGQAGPVANAAPEVEAAAAESEQPSAPKIEASSPAAEASDTAPAKPRRRSTRKAQRPAAGRPAAETGPPQPTEAAAAVPPAVGPETVHPVDAEPGSPASSSSAASVAESAAAELPMAAINASEQADATEPKQGTSPDAEDSSSTPRSGAAKSRRRTPRPPSAAAGSAPGEAAETELAPSEMPKARPAAKSRRARTPRTAKSAAAGATTDADAKPTASAKPAADQAELLTAQWAVTEPPATEASTEPGVADTGEAPDQTPAKLSDSAAATLPAPAVGPDEGTGSDDAATPVAAGDQTGTSQPDESTEPGHAAASAVAADQAGTSEPARKGTLSAAGQLDAGDEDGAREALPLADPESDRGGKPGVTGPRRVGTLSVEDTDVLPVWPAEPPPSGTWPATDDDSPSLGPWPGPPLPTEPPVETPAAAQAVEAQPGPASPTGTQSADVLSLDELPDDVVLIDERTAPANPEPASPEPADAGQPGGVTKSTELVPVTSRPPAVRDLAAARLAAARLAAGRSAAMSSARARQGARIVASHSVRVSRGAAQGITRGVNQGVARGAALSRDTAPVVARGASRGAALSRTAANEAARGLSKGATYGAAWSRTAAQGTARGLTIGATHGAAWSRTAAQGTARGLTIGATHGAAWSRVAARGTAYGAVRGATMSRHAALGIGHGVAQGAARVPRPPESVAKPLRASLVIILLIAAVVTGWVAGHGSGPAHHEIASGLAKPPGTGSVHKAPTGPAHHPAPTPTPKPSVPEALKPVSATSFDPYGDGNGSGPAHLAIDPSPSTAWHTQWYASAHFGNLKPGTGLLMNLGQDVTINDIRISLGSRTGADLEVRVGDSAASLGQLRAVAHADNVGGHLQLPLTQPAHGRYLLIWFTKLPPDRSGTYEASVYNVRLEGTR